MGFLLGLIGTIPPWIEWAAERAEYECFLKLRGKGSGFDSYEAVLGEALDVSFTETETCRDYRLFLYSRGRICRSQVTGEYSGAIMRADFSMNPANLVKVVAGLHRQFWKRPRDHRSLFGVDCER
jgi:hypothetical protein